MQFDGVHEFTQPAAEVWPKLTDARFVIPCLPDLDSIKEVDADQGSCIIKPSFSFARGVLDMTVSITDKVPGTSAKMIMVSKGIGGSSTIEATLTLEPREDGGCRMKWTAAITQLTGLLRAAPPSLVQAAGKKILDQAWANVQTKIAAEAGPSPETPSSEKAS
jgi:carbon monoxide dehydrogenase subunit G